MYEYLSFDPQELAKFATFVVRQFTNVAKINKKIFVDMLFWKSKSEALAVTSGYDFSAKRYLLFYRKVN